MTTTRDPVCLPMVKEHGSACEKIHLEGEVDSKHFPVKKTCLDVELDGITGDAIPAGDRLFHPWLGKHYRCTYDSSCELGKDDATIVSLVYLV